MIIKQLKFTALATIIFSAAASHAARDPSAVYSSELKKAKLQYPTSSDELCDSESSTSCIGFRESGIWWLYDSSDYVGHAISGIDGERNELRNRAEFNMMSTSKTFSGTLQRISTSSINHVTVLQLHRNASGSKPVVRIQYDHNNSQYEYTVALDEKAAQGYCKGSFATSGSGTKYFKITPKTVDGERVVLMTLAGETIDCSIEDWPSESTYYFKMGTYLSDGDGSAEFKYADWDWNQ